MIKSNYILETVLEQITPYINEIDIKKKRLKEAPSKEKGNDILRTTEFKPRFDKFLLNKYKKEEISDLLLTKNDNEKEKSDSFDYKITVEKYDSKTDYEARVIQEVFLTSGQPYYGRVDNVKLKLKFFSLRSRMIKMIEDNLAEFLAVTNFGKRKNKCYGSFYIAKEDAMYKDIDEINILREYNFFKKNGKKVNYLAYNVSNIKTLFEKELEIQDGKGKRLLKRPLVVLRSSKDRKESFGIMKVLKKDNEYRLYFIPNIELIKALFKDKKYEAFKIEEKSIYKKTDCFNYDEFFNYVEKLK